MEKDIHDSLLFAGLDYQYIDEFLASFPEVTHLKKGQFLWRQNDAGNSMYLLKKGQVEVIIHYNQPVEEDVIISAIEAGAVIGEVCVFGEKTRSASVRAVTDSELLMIDGDHFREKIQQRDVGALLMSYNVAKMLTQRLIAANEFIRKLQQIVDKPAVKSELEHYRQRFFHESLFN